jgi:hypothetical protein
MTPEKAALLAELTAERFPNPDVLLSESRRPVPTREQTTAERNEELQAAAKDARRRWATRDTPQAIAMRRRVLDAMPVDHRDVDPVVRVEGAA